MYKDILSRICSKLVRTVTYINISHSLSGHIFWLFSETLLVIPTVGIQSSIKYIYGKEVYFIPWPSVDDVIINEVIQLVRILLVLD